MWCPDFDVVVVGKEAVTSVDQNFALKLQSRKGALGHHWSDVQRAKAACNLDEAHHSIDVAASEQLQGSAVWSQRREVFSAFPT